MTAFSAPQPPSRMAPASDRARLDPPAPYPRLVADVGGTHACLGWVLRARGGVADVAQFACDDHASLEAVIEHYLGGRGGPPPAACAIAMATPVVDDRVAMTNRDWSFSVRALRQRLGVDRLVVLNDFAALALALPELSPAEVVAVGGGKPVAGAPQALLGPGTGLGVGALVGPPDAPWALAGEGGHASLSAADEAEERVIGFLRHEFGHASAERALSGSGLVNLYAASCALRGRAAKALQPADVAAHAIDGSDADCRDAVEMFFALLGGVAGNLALTLGARGGVYVGGGIVPRFGDWIGRSRFRQRFEGKGRFSGYLCAIPVWTIRSAGAPALRGANRALEGGASLASVGVQAST